MEAITCLSVEQLSTFFNLLIHLVERVGENYVVHATAGDVVWSFNETSNLWCIK